ncbi:hypothetical protein K1T71_003693 [Dendrolimus kikuchii]|uniref:Uncharacterized protein n=1 Tax=Dendrolimus kikuchii TaxID=765133 RepID=A0ACC1D8K2_9NEOP|nr:hypothetical protein K1T71_003693 [Dendrolimus kikuchii]
MSFLQQLQKQKNKLKDTDTVVTKTDGKRYLESKHEVSKQLTSCYGFVVDTKPDNVPVMIMEHLYIGSQDCTSQEVLNEYNIKRVLSLGIDIETNIGHKYVQCLDLPETDVRPILEQSLPFIKEGIDNNENLLIHCNAGVSRTSTVAIAYLMHYEKMTFNDAYDLVKRKRPSTQPNTGFRKQLQLMIPGQII